MSKNAPQTGPEAIEYALSQLTREDIENEAKSLLATKKKTFRSRAVSLLNIAKGLERNNLEPKDYMIHAVPVVPTKFRPFAASGDTIIPGDANVLYKDLMDVLGAYKEERDVFGNNNVGQSRLSLYDAVKSVYGYGDAVKPKTKAKDIQGFLKKIVGKTAKHSLFQSKMLAKTQDNVGRSTIVVNPDYGIDEIGLPRDMAFTMYAPYVQRRLKQMGLSDADALKHTKDKTDLASRALEEVATSRPVVYSRAPAWHKFSVQAAYPKLIDGDAIAMNTFVMQGLGGDFDGNCVIGSTQITMKISADSPFWEFANVMSGLSMDFDGLLQKNVKIVLDNKKSAMYTDAVMRINAKTKITAQNANGNILQLPIESVPYLPHTKRYDKNGAEVYDVIPGLSVLSTAVDGKGTRWEPITTLTVEDGCTLRKVTTARKRTVIVSDNESMAALDYKTCSLIKVKPDDIKDRLVPVIRSFPVPEGDASFNYGWFLGMYISDGTFDGQLMTFTKAEDAVRIAYLRRLGMLIDNENIMDMARTYAEYHTAETNYGISGNSVKIHIMGSNLPNWLKEVLLDCYDEKLNRHSGDSTDRACLHKRFPKVVYTWGKTALIGLLCGLLEGDGSFGINRSKKRKTPQLLVNISTSAPGLRDGVLWLGKMLGIHVSVTETHPSEKRVQRNVSYTCTLSTPDLKVYADKLEFIHDYSEHLDMLKAAETNNFDLVPISYNVIDFVHKHTTVEERKAVGITTNAIATVKSDANKASCRYVGMKRSTAEAYGKLILLAKSRETIENNELDLFLTLLQDKTTGWEKVKSVENAPAERVYDIAVPGTKVFALENGLVIYDTINVHVPASDSAVKEAKEKLMPSQTPFSDRLEGKIVPNAKQEQVLGLYTAATAPSTTPVVFDTEEEAVHAIKRGEVPLSADVVVRGGVKMASATQNKEMQEQLTRE